MAEDRSRHRLTSGLLWVVRWFVLPPVLVYAFVFATGALWDTRIGRFVMYGLLGICLAGLFAWAWQIEKRNIEQRRSRRGKSRKGRHS